MNRKCSIFLTGACSLLLAAYLTACKRAMSPDVLARVGDREIRVEEFVRHQKSRQLGNPVPVDAQRLLDELVAREVLVQNARKAGLENDEEVREQIRDILIAKLKERQLSPQVQAVTVSDAEVKAAYEVKRSSYTTPERVHLAMLYLRPLAGSGEAGTTEVRRRLEAAKSQIRQVSLSNDHGFGPLAVNTSEDQETRYRGGDLGWVDREHYPQRLEAKVIETGFALKEVGEISDVIRGEHGFYLVKLLGRQAPSVLPLEKVEPGLRSSLLREKQGQIEEKFFATLRESMPVEIHPERLPTNITDREPAANLPPRLP